MYGHCMCEHLENIPLHPPLRVGLLAIAPARLARSKRSLTCVCVTCVCLQSVTTSA